MEANRQQSKRDGEAIIRQSQLERSIELFQLFEVKPTLREVLRLSQILTNFQYDWNVNNYEILKFEKHFGQSTNDKLLDSVPHVQPDPVTKSKSNPVSDYQSQIAKQLKGK